MKRSFFTLNLRASASPRETGSRNLGTLRDTLLPKLLSEEFCVVADGEQVEDKAEFKTCYVATSKTLELIRKGARWPRKPRADGA